MFTPDEEIQLAALIRETAHGEISAMETLYREVSTPLFAVLLRILKSEAIAEEALQETFVKIWTRAAQYESERARPMAWLISIARNQAIDTLRYQQVRIDHDVPENDRLMDSLRAAEDIDAPDNQERRQWLTYCLEGLQVKQRFCIVKAYLYGYSIAELSKNLDTPEGTIKSWLHRSLRSLRNCLDELDR